jgi:hypothetical protein
MTQMLTAVYTDGVFKPLNKVDLPVDPQTYLLFVVPRKEVDELAPAVAKPQISVEQRIADLVAELRTDLAGVTPDDFKFDDEHKKMFLEHAEGLAPYIPAMIPEE